MSVLAEDEMTPEERTGLVRQKENVEQWLRGSSFVLPIHLFASDPPLTDRVARELVWWARRIGCMAERNGDVISIRRLRR